MNTIETIASAINDEIVCFPLSAPTPPPIPYATYQVISQVPELDLTSQILLINYRIQVDVFSSSYAEAQEKALAVRDALGEIGGLPMNATDLYEDVVRLYRVTQDFSFWS
jgi:hypothetical protein